VKRLAPWWGLLSVLILGVVSLAQMGVESAGSPPRETTVRIGFFPTLTHGPVLLAAANGAFQEAAGPGFHVEEQVFESGPFLVEALFAEEIDLAAVGPNPAATGYVRSRGEAVRVVAGCCSGGASLVARAGTAVAAPADLAGRTLAVPSPGNTQAFAAGAWLAANGLDAGSGARGVLTLPVPSPEQLLLLRRGELDSAWAPEPWASRLVHEGGGARILDERTLWPDGRFASALLVAHPRFLARHPDLARRLVAAHARTVAWIRQHPDDARGQIAEAIYAHTRQRLPKEVVHDAFSRVEFTTDPLPATVAVMADRAFRAGFLGKSPPDLSGMYDMTLLPSSSR
jgi:NitT/TauT family transport system substrate-binding protein